MALTSKSSPFPAPTLDAWLALLQRAGTSAAALHTRTLDGLDVAPLYHAESGPTVPVPPRLRRGWDLIEPVDGEPPEWADHLAQAWAGGATHGWVSAPPDGSDVAGEPTWLTALVEGLPHNRGLWIHMGVPPVSWQAHVVAVSEGSVAGRVHLLCDPLGNLATWGGLASGIDERLARAVALAQSLRAAAPLARSLLCDGVPYHAAGASAVDELAAVVCTLLAYLRAPGSTTEVLGAMVLRFALGGDVLVDVAKLRAARVLMAGVAAQVGGARFGATVPIHAVTGLRAQARGDVDTNLIRAALQALAGALGGADAIAIAPHDLTGGDDARRLARNISHVLAEEAHLARVSDPCAGSFAVEQLTAQLAHKAWARVQQVEQAGGLAAWLVDGRWQAEVAATAAARVEAVATGVTPLVGVSKYGAKVAAGGQGSAARPPSQASPQPDAAASDTSPPEPGAVGVTPLQPLDLCQPYEALEEPTP